jgi:hypothetical protein
MGLPQCQKFWSEFLGQLTVDCVKVIEKIFLEGEVHVQKLQIWFHLPKLLLCFLSEDNYFHHSKFVLHSEKKQLQAYNTN